MKLVSSKAAGVNRWELVIEVGEESWAEALKKAVKKVTKQIQVPGFRKGKVPRHMIEKLYGPGIFYEDAVNDVYPYAYSDAVKEAGIEPVDAADVELVSVDDNGLTFKATVTTKPVPVMGQYKGLSAVKSAAPISEEDVDKRLAAVREQYARLVPVEDRKTQKGDTAVIDFEGFVDGVAFDGGKGENYSLELGSNTFIPGFEDQVEDRAVDESFDVNVTFPEDYGEETLAGKPAVFKCKVNAIKVRELPEMDDEFAKDISDFDTIAEYRADLKAKMEQGSAEQAQMQFENELLRKVIENMEVDVPECMIKQGINDCLNEYGARLGQQGLTLDDFIRYTGQTREQFAESFRPKALDQVKSRLALEKIAELEGLEVSDEEVDAHYAKMAEDYKIEADKVREFVPAEDVRSDMLCRKAMDTVIAAAVALDAPEEEAPAAEAPAEEAPAAEAPAEEAPAEKPAKKTVRRTKKTAENAEEAPAEKPVKKTVRRTKKAAEGEAPAEEKKPARRTKKAAAEE